MMDSGFSFDLRDTLLPDVVIRGFTNDIENVTNGYVSGDIQKYNGHVYSYTKKVSLGVSGLLNNLESHEEEYDIQNDLGAQNTTLNKYEVFLTVKNLENYKYRIMFVSYSSVAYPVRIVLDESIARDLGNQGLETIFNVASMVKLEELCQRIFHSNKLHTIIQSCINESLRREIAETNGGINDVFSVMND